MVLWEITLATAYFLGLKRTYKLALKIQRRLVSPKHPRIRQFLRGRTRSIFDVAVKVHQNVQHQDIEVGMKMIKQVSNSYLKHRASPRAVISQKFDQYMSITSSIRRWPKPFPTFAMIMRQPKPAGTKIQYRQYSICGSEAMETNYRRGSFDCVIREDILQWMLRS
ncbi:uncharacterized protein LOC111025863 isoform X2 [Momordica charantia]|uniref:Uncharacterized protein LOC111025863 isoform X2 n=1 Tax=Momordica charantia TaxID=3673 RepID=A0A6J1E2E5_MOMCH|nr:uncharacterized protein LOC111025863 isoform X2 [Momordica charantia]